MKTMNVTAVAATGMLCKNRFNYGQENGGSVTYPSSERKWSALDFLMSQKPSGDGNGVS